MIKKIKTLYVAIKFEHTIFALPGHGFSSAWHTNAMANYLDYPGNGRRRSFAMALNRPVDASQDVLNPRTAMRALPQRLIKPFEILLFALVSFALFIYVPWP